MPFNLTVIKELLDRFFTSLNKHVDGGADKIVAAIKSSEKGDVNSAVDNQTRVLSSIAQRLESAIAKIQEPTFSGEVTVDTSALDAELRGIAKDVQALSKMKLPDLKNVEAMLKLIYDCIEKLSEATNRQSEALTKAISAIKLAVPDTFSLDKNQLRALTGSMGGSAVASVPMATRVSNTTVSATASNTEYSYVFPSGTVGWTIKLRDQGTLAYYSWTTGKMPAGGDSSTYMTIPQNFLRSVDNVDYSGKTIYLGAEANTQTFEIEVFRV